MLILPVSHRLYTSVIPWNLEIWADKESWSTDLSPTTILLCVSMTVSAEHAAGRAGRGVPGVGTGRVGGRAIPVPHRTLPGPVFSHILASRPYPRPYEGNLRLNMTVL